MTDIKDTTPAYRTADLPGLGQVQIPLGVSDAQVLAQVFGGEQALDKDTEATPTKKTKKKP